MKKILLLTIFALLTTLFANNQTLIKTQKLDVVFINPGKSNELFWTNVSKFMEAAANDLNMNLEVIYAQRNHYKMLEILQNLVKKDKKPDFLIVVNENNMADKLLAIANKHKIKTMLLLNDLSFEQKEVLGKPREIYKYWIGTVIPDNIQAGYLIANSLIKASKKKNINMLAINGDEATFAARHRARGLNQALKENPKVKLLQKFIADWNEDLAYKITSRALNRYKNIDMIWAANDPMAFGAIKAIKEQNKKILVSGLNWSKEGIIAVENGDMVANIGGHFMAGAWALVLLYDYTNNKDFKEEGLEFKQNIFQTIDIKSCKEYLDFFKEVNYAQIDFKKFSKHEDKNIEKYDFSLEKILGQLRCLSTY